MILSALPLLVGCAATRDVHLPQPDPERLHEINETGRTRVARLVLDDASRIRARGLEVRADSTSWYAVESLSGVGGTGWLPEETVTRDTDWTSRPARTEPTGRIASISFKSTAKGAGEGFGFGVLAGAPWSSGRREAWPG